MFLYPWFCEIMFPKKQGKSYGTSPKSKAACDALNLSNKITILDPLKGSVSLGEVGWHGKTESSIHNIWDKKHEIISGFCWAVSTCNFVTVT